MTKTHRPQINIAANFAEGGWAQLGAGLDDLLQGHPTKVCSTIAMLFMQLEPDDVDRYTQAVVALALYASGVRVTMETREFRRLERRVLHYMLKVGGWKYHKARNHDYARYIWKRAVKRAKREKLI